MLTLFGEDLNTFLRTTISDFVVFNNAVDYMSDVTRVGASPGECVSECVSECVAVFVVLLVCMCVCLF